MHKFLHQAIDQAHLADHHQKVGAIIFDKSKIISRGHNYSCKSVRKLHPKFQKWPGSIHAEVDSIIKAKVNLKGKSILVIRVNRQDQLRMAKPCKWCMMYLVHVGIHKVYYSIDKYPYIAEILVKKLCKAE